MASAKRGVLGGLREDEEEDESAEGVRVGVRFKATGRFLSSLIAILILADGFFFIGIDFLMNGMEVTSLQYDNCVFQESGVCKTTAWR